LRELAELVGGRVEGDASVIVTGIAPLDAAGPGELTFADDRHAAELANCRASAALVGQKAQSASMPLVRVASVQAAVGKVLGLVAGPEDLPPVGRHPTAIIAPDAAVGPDAAIGPGVVIGAGASVGPRSVLCANVCLGAGVAVGADTVLFEGVVVRRGCRLGDRVRVGPNSVIGFEGFGYYFEAGAHRRVPHGGVVVIEDDVELGACTCIDRAKFGATRIGAGTKVDNLVQIAHNVRVGRNCLMAAQVGIAGSARLGEMVVLGGGAGVRDNITIGDRAQSAAHAAIAADVPAEQIVAGMPAVGASEYFRMYKSLQRLPELMKTVREMDARLKAVESAKDHTA
jgi:UDP-3-O-[3-hydroxymyristoyl] glucosamine N-acyltransferase